MYECFHCMNRTVIWDNDFSFDDLNYDGDGIVHFCHCVHCGAMITYWIPFDQETEKSYDHL